MRTVCQSSSLWRNGGSLCLRKAGRWGVFRKWGDILSKNPLECNEATKMLSCKWEWKGRKREKGGIGFLHDWFWQRLTSISSVCYSREQALVLCCVSKSMKYTFPAACTDGWQQHGWVQSHQRQSCRDRVSWICMEPAATEYSYASGPLFTLMCG